MKQLLRGSRDIQIDLIEPVVILPEKLNRRRLFVEADFFDAKVLSNMFLIRRFDDNRFPVEVFRVGV